MRIGVAVGWPFRYTTCWVELGSSESDSDWTFFFFVALSIEGVEETNDPTPERKLVLFSSSDASFLSGIGSSVSSTPSLERAIKKKKIHSESDSDDANSTQQVVYRKGQPTATPILIYEESRREVVQQFIANLMPTFHLYPHSEVIASSFTERFEDMLRWLYKTDKANRDSCKHWRGWSREKFVEHLRLLYPQLSNAADKSYLEMIKEIPFQYDLDSPVLELKFQSELSKIVSYHCGRSRGSKNFTGKNQHP